MANQDLLHYIREHLAAGSTRESIVSSLVTAGWPQAAVDEAMMEFPAGGVPVPPPSVATPPMAGQPTVAAQPAATGKYQMPGSWALTKEAMALSKRHIGQLSILIVFWVAISSLSLISPLFDEGVAKIAVAVVVWLIQSILGAWIAIAAIRRLLDKPATDGIGTNLSASAGFIWPYLIISFFAGTVTMGSLVMLFVGPALFGVWCLFSPTILIDEDIRGMRAIVRGRELTRGRWWMIVGYSILLAVILFIPAAILVGIGAAVSFPLLLVNPTLAGLIPSIFLAPIFVVAGAWSISLYRHLKLARGPIEPFPKPGQMKWYWILFVIGLLMPLVMIAAFASTIVAMLSSGTTPNL